MARLDFLVIVRLGRRDAVFRDDAGFGRLLARTDVPRGKRPAYTDVDAGL